jgi:PIN domain nuclease of toxin-antitoxin system
MPRYVLDMSALQTLYCNELGSERVAGLLTQTLDPETLALPGVAVLHVSCH